MSRMDHYDYVIMGAIASQITSLTIVCSSVYSGADQSKHQISASLAFVWGIRRGPVNSPHKWPVTWKMLPFDDVILQAIQPLPKPTGTFFTTSHTQLFFLAVLKFSTICNVRDLWKYVSSCKRLRLLYPPHPWNLPGTALLRGFQNSQGILKSTE